MVQPAHLDSFLRLLVYHLGSVIAQGEMLIDAQSSQGRMDMLLHAIEQADCNAAHEKSIKLHHENEHLFIEQVMQLRDWVDMLGRIDINIERSVDEFLATTLFMDQFSYDQKEGDLAIQINIDMILCAIFELLGRLEEQYDMMEVVLEDERAVVNGLSHTHAGSSDHQAKIIPLFPGR